MAAIRLFHIPRRRITSTGNGTTSLNPMMHHLVQTTTSQSLIRHKKMNHSQKSSHRTDNSPYHWTLLRRGLRAKDPSIILCVKKWSLPAHSGEGPPTAERVKMEGSTS